MLWTIVVGVVKLCLVSLAVLYGGVVAVALQTERHQDHVQFDWNDPARAVARFLVWVGVRIANQALHVLKASLNLLEEASADVGEWVLQHRRT